MRKVNIFLVLFLFISSTSCISYPTYNTYTTKEPEYSHFLCSMNIPLEIFEYPDKKSDINMVIPTGKQFVAKRSTKKDYWIIRYNKNQGYLYKPHFHKQYGVSNDDLKYIYFSDNTGYYFDYVEKDKETKSSNYNESTVYTPKYSNGTNYQSSGGGDVYVKGYYRKDGTYVRSHTRSSPKKSSYKSSSRRRK